MRPFNFDPREAFDAAARAFAASPNADTLLILNAVAVGLTSVLAIAATPDASPVPPAMNQAWNEPDADDFAEIRATFDRPLSAAEQVEANAAIGYALRIYVAGGELPLPIVTEVGKVLTFEYDSSDRRRTSPDYGECFAEAARFVREGSPVRCSNRAGAGTKGTRLCRGVGKIGVTFTVR